MSTYAPADNRYDSMEYRRCGNSGLKLPRVSLGLWNKFGSVNVHENARQLLQGDVRQLNFPGKPGLLDVAAGQLEGFGVDV